ncbi:hypothetical protein LR48_Vigan02g117500 [Vigna angularis]|uniref:Uncharacterized protein n=1 Tax=Phaseolus angularis TaxID=3914 RepID=A0A0L9TWW5_PHAAN|nr:hypothetical protein LR48_Vigan02g117500 [Vigna angularis]
MTHKDKGLPAENRWTQAPTNNGEQRRLQWRSESFELWTETFEWRTQAPTNNGEERGLRWRQSFEWISLRERETEFRKRLRERIDKDEGHSFVRDEGTNRFQQSSSSKNALENKSQLF